MSDDVWKGVDALDWNRFFVPHHARVAVIWGARSGISALFFVQDFERVGDAVVNDLNLAWRGMFCAIIPSHSKKLQTPLATKGCRKLSITHGKADNVNVQLTFQ